MAKLTEIVNSIIEKVNLNTAKETNVTTDLSVGNKTATSLDVVSSDGTNATIPSVTATEAGLVSVANKETWDGKQDALGFTPEDSANKGAINGYAELDGTGKVPASQLPNQSYVDNKPTGFKNYIINGGFDVWQRGTNFSSFISGVSADRWICRAASSFTPSVYTISRGFSSSYGGYFKLDVSGADSNWYVETHLENPSHFSSKTLTFSFDSIGNISNPAQVFRARIYLWTTTNQYVHINSDVIYTMSTETTRESITFTCPDFGQYTIDSNSYLLVGIENVGIIADGSYRFGRFQLEEGSVATPFEQRPYGLELSLCQRYYAKNSGHSWLDNSTTANAYSGGYGEFPVDMRTTPSLSQLGGNKSNILNNTVNILPVGTRNFRTVAGIFSIKCCRAI